MYRNPHLFQEKLQKIVQRTIVNYGSVVENFI